MRNNFLVHLNAFSTSYATLPTTGMKRRKLKIVMMTNQFKKKKVSLPRREKETELEIQMKAIKVNFAISLPASSLDGANCDIVESDKSFFSAERETSMEEEVAE